MKPARFEYHAPTTIDEAVGLLGQFGDEAKVLAGGQSLVPILALRLARFEHLVDLNKIPALQYIDARDDALSIGAMTRQSAAEHSVVVANEVPLLTRAIPHIGHFQIRNRGTVGGSLSHADPASELPAVATTLGAEFELVSVRGTRRIPASEFFVSVWETVLEQDELTAAVHFPRRKSQSGFAIEELAWRTGDFAITGVTVGIWLSDDGRIAASAISFMGMGSTPIRAEEAEIALVGADPGTADYGEISALAVEGTDPSDDVHASGDYRKRAARSLLERALSAAVAEAQDG